MNEASIFIELFQPMGFRREVVWQWFLRTLWARGEDADDSLRELFFEHWDEYEEPF